MMKALEYHRGAQNYIIIADAIILGVVNSLVRTYKVINNRGLSKFNVCQWIAHKTDSAEQLCTCLAFMTHSGNS